MPVISSTFSYFLIAVAVVLKLTFGVAILVVVRRRRRRSAPPKHLNPKWFSAPRRI